MDKQEFINALVDNAPNQSESFTSKPLVYTTYRDGVKRPLDVIGKEGLEMIVNQNENFYHTRGTLGRIESNEHGTPVIRILDTPGIQGYLSKSATFVGLSQKAVKGGIEEHAKIQSPLKDYAQNILSYQTYGKVRKLRSISHHPVLTQNGHIDFSVGYNPDTQIYVPSESYFDVIEMTVEKARNLLLDLISDFVFDTDYALFMALSLPLTMICRGYINDSTPIFGFVGGTGAGKTLLVKTLYALVTGHRVNELQAPHTNAEWNKSVFAALLSGEGFVFYDNVNRRDNFGNECTLESNALASATTSGMFTDRILGVSQTQSIPVNATFALSGIETNLYVSAELYRRIVFVHISPNDIKSSCDFTHFPLNHHAKHNREELLSAYIVLVQNWINKEYPNGSFAMDGFERWSSVMSGIWEAAGVVDIYPEKLMCPQSRSEDETRFKRFLDKNYVYAPEKTMLVQDLVQEVKDFYGENCAIIPSPQKRNKWIMERFPNAVRTKFSQNGGARVWGWKGISLK